MRFRPTSISGVTIFEPEPHHDERGFFSRTFDAGVCRQAGIDPDSFVQDSVSRSHRGVIRGLHVRLGWGEGKLVRCSSGSLFDVIVDLRPESPTRGHWLSVELDDESQRSVYIPPGCAHGFQALAEPTDTSYRITREHDPSEELAIAHDDETLKIPWPLKVSAMSRADRDALPLAGLCRQLQRIDTGVGTLS